MIDLSACYTRPMLKALHAAGMGCVYVLAYEEGQPCRIGYAKRPVGKITELRRANARPLVLHHLVWTPSLGVAMLIDQGARDRIQVGGIQQEWHWCNVQAAIDAVNYIVQSLYANASFVIPHQQMLRRIENEKALRA